MSDRPSTKAIVTAKTDIVKSGLRQIDVLAGNDRITGESLFQTIYGGSGNDLLRGAGGNGTP